MGSDCLNNIPYGSVVGCIFCLVGAGVMGGTMWEALRLTNERILREHFSINFDWAMYLQFASLALSGVVALIALLLIVFGYLTTKATQQHMYREDVCTMGGRCTACCCLSITYLLSIVWVLVFAMISLPVICWLMMTSICSYEKKSDYNYTFNLNNYGIYEYMLPQNSQWTVSGSAFSKMCEAADYIGPLYGAALAGSLMVIFGLFTSVASISSLRMRLKFAKQFVSLKGCSDEQTADELQSFLVQNARAAGTGAYQLQSVTSGTLMQSGQNTLGVDQARSQAPPQVTPAQNSGAHYAFEPATGMYYAEPTRDARVAGQFDRSKAASPSVQHDARINSKSTTMQFDQRSIQQQPQYDQRSIQQPYDQRSIQQQPQYDQRSIQQQAQFDQRSIPQFDARNQSQFAPGAYSQSQLDSQAGSISQLNIQMQNMGNMSPTGHHQAMANNQTGLFNMTNYFASVNRGASNGGRADMGGMQAGPLPSYNTAVHGAYMQANANMQLGLHDMNAYQLGSNDMKAAGSSIEEDGEADTDWNMQMNANILKQ